MASGLETETMRQTAVRLGNGQLFGAPVEGQLGMRMMDKSAGHATTWMPIPVGALADAADGARVATGVLADTAGGVALSAYNGRGHGGPTIELRLDHVAPPAQDAGALIATARVLHEAGGAAYVTAEVRDDTDRIVARATGHYLLLSRGSQPVAALPAPAGNAPAGNGAGTNASGSNGAGTNASGSNGAGTNGSVGYGAGELDGFAPGSADELFRALGPAGGDPAVWSLAAAERLANGRGDVHGGILLAIGQLAQQRFQLADSAGMARPRPLSTQAEYLRPVPADGAELTCRTEYVRRGRAFRTVRCQLVRSDGRVAAVVSGLWSSADSAIR